MSKLGSIGHGLYTGQISFDFVGRWRRWFTLSAVVIVIGLIGLGVRGLHLGLEFKGGTEFTFPDKGYSTSQVADVVSGAGVSDPVVQHLSRPGVGGATFQVQTKALDKSASDAVIKAITTKLGVPADEVSTTTVGASWGKQITNKAVESLIVFLVAVVLYLTLFFEWKMAISAIIALLHDLIITVGIYALVGFDVTPATVIGLLTILGYSLYDTVVVFDKVRENTRGIAGGSRMTYSQAANLAVNQTLVRSINTSVIALLPVASLLFVGAGLLGAGSLKDLALALFVGLATGTYSSIFVATPILTLLKEREPQFRALAKRVATRYGGQVPATVPVAVAAGGGTVTAAIDPAAGSPSAHGQTPAPGDASRRDAPADDGDDGDGTPSAQPIASGAVIRRQQANARRRGRPSSKKRRR
ncbi:protein translocase subunit secF [Acidothermus cellulolyticus 11B]|uniref:Protein-export membrane protein SecF n=1 Tax=Acidothermus cellulolyticus (strain ATCC 43068 / DSM 8971 / 11B) TaxID=351607 RepID=A0LUK2_ACIC1|nr:protein translocase subunit SecF [Acidothermus cellulolyticus]ABK53112.1 protein translocase subunit secF [Acidothermus cellulolyticus 11B]MCL6551190.1 protein translocase subunit SecF [Acidothermus cellulolyticus]